MFRSSSSKLIYQEYIHIIVVISVIVVSSSQNNYSILREDTNIQIWRRRTNLELYMELNVDFVRLGRLRWPGHEDRLNPTGIPKKSMEKALRGIKTRGRPTLHWDMESLAILGTWSAIQTGWLLHKIGPTGGSWFRRPWPRNGLCAIKEEVQMIVYK